MSYTWSDQRLADSEELFIAHHGISDGTYKSRKFLEHSQRRTYTCQACKQDKGYEEFPADVILDYCICTLCSDDAEQENAHLDGHHYQKPNPDCALCKAERNRKEREA